jgi:hypothetical protein
MILSILLLAMVSLLYWVGFALFTFSLPLRHGRDLKGAVCKPLIAQMFPECPFLDLSVLQMASYDPLNLWREWSITVVGVALASAWLLATMLLTIAIGTFLVFHGDGKRTRERSTAPTPKTIPPGKAPSHGPDLTKPAQRPDSRSRRH